MSFFEMRFFRKALVLLTRYSLVALSISVSAFLQAQSIPEYELPPIEYSKTGSSNRVTAIQDRLPSRDAQTDLDFLKSALSLLEIPVESQVLVFSRTSLQAKSIRPDHPRAIYFSDDCYVGWVPGGLLEATVSDPKLGLAFYQMDPHPKDGMRRFERESGCLACHGGSQTRNWPGLTVRSVYPDRRGDPILSAGTFLTEHDSPISDRWGGWYVTGRHGAARHMGNVTATESEDGASLDRESGANLDNLSKLFDVSQYLRPDSDIVALMVLEHQVGMHNRLCKGGLRVRKWLDYQRTLQKALNEPVTEQPTGTALLVVRSEAQAIVEHLLFSGEAELPEGGIQGAAAFERSFLNNKRVDAAGRSLKDLDLEKHLFRYRCSYMIYSSAFQSLPRELKAEISRQLGEVLLPAEPLAKFGYLQNSERQAIREILVATLPEVTAQWKTFSGARK
jgi:hypothetical protein